MAKGRMARKRLQQDVVQTVSSASSVGSGPRSEFGHVLLYFICLIDYALFLELFCSVGYVYIRSSFSSDLEHRVVREDDKDQICVNDVWFVVSDNKEPCLKEP